MRFGPLHVRFYGVFKTSKSLSSDLDIVLLPLRSSAVVSYGIPASNHNLLAGHDPRRIVISYIVPTSSHNRHRLQCALLHVVSYNSYIRPQRFSAAGSRPCGCILYNSYIKPQHRFVDLADPMGCILYNSYIKPQQSILHI